MSLTSAVVPSPAKTRMTWALIASRRGGGSGAKASANSRPAKQELRLANKAQEMFTGQGVTSRRNSGLLATRAPGAV
jgi:hypothetical protein